MSQLRPPQSPRLERARRGKAVMVGAVACLALALVGCGREQTATDPTTTAPRTSSVPAPTLSASATTSVYAAPADAYVKPTRPASLDGPPSEDAAIDFAKYYLRMYTYAYLTGDATELNALGRTGCVFCANVAADIAREYGAGGHDEGGAITVVNASAHDYHADGTFKVVIYGRQAPNREVDGNGTSVSEHPATTNYEFDFAPVWTSTDRWHVGDLGVVAQ